MAKNPASLHNGKPGYDVVIANPPFGAVKTEGESKVFNLSDIQPGYRTHEIDHAIALRALQGMRDDGRAVLILGGLNKLLSSREARSDGYNGKAKREFFKVLQDNYNVTDHFTVAGELYERQGAGWPVDVVVIHGRGKSQRPLPSVDVPRIYKSWDELGNILDGLQPAAGHAGAVSGADDGAIGVGAGPAAGDGAGGESAGGQRVRGGRSEPDKSADVQPGSVPERGAVEAGGDRDQNAVQPGKRGQSGRPSVEAAAERRPSGLDDFDKAFDDALDDTFGPQAGPKSLEDRAYERGRAAFAEGKMAASAQDAGFTPLLSEASKSGKTLEALKAWQKGFTEANLEEPTPGVAETPSQKRGRERKEKAADTRSTPEVAKSAVENATGAADDAFSALYKLFGGKDPMFGMGLKFDPETYAKAKPEFVKAASKFGEFASDMRELLRRMMAHMRDVLKWPREILEAMRPYFKRFMEEVQQGILSLGKKADEAVRPKRAAAEAGIETENQVTYTPKSETPGMGTLVPVNMRRSISDSLDALANRVGNIDNFVASELGYKKAELEDYFGAEQVDALALAIDNIKRGKGFIIGDQTGIGKGRVNAAIIRWAIKNDRVPIFVTKTPPLYADMYRDLQDIGISDGFLKGEPRILTTNNGLNLPLDEAGKVKLVTGDSKSHNALLAKNSNPDDLRKNYDMVFTTYSQMQTVKETETARRNLLRSLAPNSVVIFDESHEAGGQKTGRKSEGPANRSGFARDLIANANGVFYSSATYAKRPDVMDLYAATDMAMAVDKIEDLAEAIARGGVPMQQVVASMLAKGGQYIRRERSFAGVTYDTPLVSVDHAKYDGISNALNLINEFSKHVQKTADSISEDIKAEAESVGYDNATGAAGADSVNFTSIMHNVINKMLLSMKAEPAAKMAIESLKRGEKPVLTVANTMESFFTDFADTLGIEPGEPMPADFSDVLQKYLDRTRTLIIKKPFAKKGDSERKYLTDEELGTIGLNAYREAKDVIGRIELSDLPMSPLDHIKNQLEKAGYKVGEITGRGTYIDYSGEDPVWRTRPSAETSLKGRRDANTKFNNGGLDAILLNQAGSTGISLHASERFKDQRQRHMIIVQPEANIDTHMQMLGRVHRTGQIVVPSYSQLIADIPAEKRPAAVLAKKMASLNANTTASRGGALTAKDVPDFINEYGDAVAAAYLHDNPEMMSRLGLLKMLKESGGVDRPDAMRKLTGRLPLLPLEKQEESYDHLESEYDALLKQMEAAGANSLEAKTLDLKARTLENSEVVPAKGESTSPFAAPVNIEKVSIARLGKPFKPEEVVRKVLRAALLSRILPESLGSGVKLQFFQISKE